MVVFGLFFGGLASFFVWKGVSLGSSQPIVAGSKVVSQVQTDQVERSYEEWKQVVEKRPDYRDGYVRLAWYARELGKTEEEQSYLQKIRQLDPNYQIPQVLVAE